MNFTFFFHSSGWAVWSQQRVCYNTPCISTGVADGTSRRKYCDIHIYDGGCVWVKSATFTRLYPLLPTFNTSYLNLGFVSNICDNGRRPGECWWHLLTPANCFVAAVTSNRFLQQIFQTSQHAMFTRSSSNFEKWCNAEHPGPSTLHFVPRLDLGKIWYEDRWILRWQKDWLVDILSWHHWGNGWFIQQPTLSPATLYRTEQQIVAYLSVLPYYYYYLILLKVVSEWTIIQWR